MLRSLGHQPEAPTKQIWKACPAYQAALPAWPLRPWWEMERAPQSRGQVLGALPTTLDPGAQHLPGLGGHRAHEVTPQKAPTLPQQSSWVVSSSRGLAHWKRGHGHLSPLLPSPDVHRDVPGKPETRAHLPYLPEDAPTQGRGEESACPGRQQSDLWSAPPNSKLSEAGTPQTRQNMPLEVCKLPLCVPSPQTEVPKGWAFLHQTPWNSRVTHNASLPREQGPGSEHHKLRGQGGSGDSEALALGTPHLLQFPNLRSFWKYQTTTPRSGLALTFRCLDSEKLT